MYQYYDISGHFKLEKCCCGLNLDLFATCIWKKIRYEYFPVSIHKRIVSNNDFKTSVVIVANVGSCEILAS